MQKSEAIIDIIGHVSLFLMWLLFVVIHLFALVIILFVLWWVQITPIEIQTWAVEFYQQTNTQNMIVILGLVGFSLWTFAKTYLKIWIKIYSTWYLPFIFQAAYRKSEDDLSEQMD